MLTRCPVAQPAAWIGGTVDGKPGQLAIVTDDGQVIGAGKMVAREAEAVAVNSYRNFLQAKGFLRVWSNPIEQLSLKPVPASKGNPDPQR